VQIIYSHFIFSALAAAALFLVFLLLAMACQRFMAMQNAPFCSTAI